MNHLMADGFDHFADLAIPPLMDRDQQVGEKSFPADQADFRRGSHPAVDQDALAETDDFLIGNLIGNPDQISLLNPGV